MVMNTVHERSSEMSVPSNMNRFTFCLTAVWMLRICCAITDSTCEGKKRVCKVYKACKQLFEPRSMYMYMYMYKAFWPKLRSFFVVLLLQNGRCYEAEICAILLLLRCPFRWNPFLLKSNFSDFGQKPWTIIRRFGRNRGHSLWSFYSKMEGAIYEAEICTIPLLLRCSFRWNPFLPKSKFSDFGQKPWTIIRRFGRNRGHSLWSFYSKMEGAMKLKFALFRSS